MNRLSRYFLAGIILIGVCISHLGATLNINERALVHAMGIDPTENGVKITMQIFKPEGAGADTAVDAAKANVQLITCEGKTVSEALEQGRGKGGKELFFGHLQLICLGGDLDLRDSAALFAFAVKDKNIYLGTPVCLGKGSAESVLKVQPELSETSAEAMGKVIETAVIHGDTVPCELKDIIALESGGSLAMPVLKAQKQDKKGYVELMGTAVIDSGRVADILQGDKARAAALLYGRCKSSSLNFTLDGRLYGAKLSNIRLKREFTAEGGELTLTQHITLKARTVNEIRSQRLSQAAAEDIKKRLTADCSRAFSECVSENAADVFGIWQSLKHSCPNIALKYENEKDSLLKSIIFETDIEVLIE